MMRPSRRDTIAMGAAAAIFPVVGVKAQRKLAGRQREDLDRGWRFHLGHAQDPQRDFGWGLDQATFTKPGYSAGAATLARYDDGDWAEVTVPHDWAVALPFARPLLPVEGDRRYAASGHGYKAIGREFPENSVGWYRRTLDIGPADAGRRLWLEFDGVFRDCRVFVNGFLMTRHESGYAPFTCDITDYVDLAGPNVLTVRVDASLGEGWFYEGAGIYRAVTLVRTAAVHVAPHGVFVRAEPTDGSAAIEASVELVNDPIAATVTVRAQVLDPKGRAVLALPPVEQAIAPGGSATLALQGTLPAPKLWSLATRNLYRLATELVVDGTVVDRVETRFGIRSIRFDAARGFLLNGEPVKIKGVCNHQDHAGIGSAVPPAVEAFRIARMQDMGANAWRSSHNPSSASLLDLCDEMGMLFVAETRSGVNTPEGMDQLDAMIRRDRNHPCIILWSVGNEEKHQVTPQGGVITRALVDRVRTLDPTRPTVQAFDAGFDDAAALAVDVTGFNYRTPLMPAWTERHPGRSVLGTETGSTVSTRGVYVNDPARHLARAYDTEFPPWASTAEDWWTVAADHPAIAGGFIWTGFDYRGEPTPYPDWPSISSQFGVVDTCGFPKDNFHYYRAWWRAEPVLHLFPHWNWAAGTTVEIWAYSNADAVELLLNGRSLGSKAMPRNGHLSWQVPFEPGRIEARATVAGKVVATEVRATAGTAAALTLVPDRARLSGDGRDVVLATVSVVDTAGRAVPDAAAAVSFALDGPATIIGVGNGDPNCHEPDKASRRTTFHGLAQVLVRADAPGAILLSATAPGLRAASTRLIADGH